MECNRTELNMVIEIEMQMNGFGINMGKNLRVETAADESLTLTCEWKNVLRSCGWF